MANKEWEKERLMLGAIYLARKRELIRSLVCPSPYLFTCQYSKIIEETRKNLYWNFD